MHGALEHPLDVESARLSIACLASALVRPLLDGSVTIKGAESSFTILAPGELRTRPFADPAFDVAEVSLSSYVTRHCAGERDLVALPIYPARSFCLTDIYVRSDRIRSAADLRGKTILAGDAHASRVVWMKGILADEFGIQSLEANWKHVTKPAQIRCSRSVSIAEAQSAMLQRGEADALVASQPPKCFGSKAGIARLFDEATEDSYFRRTGIFPILHVIAVRRTAYDTAPDLIASLLGAFEAAKKKALADGENRAAESREPHLFHGTIDRLRKLIGADPYPYGLGAHETKTLEAFLQYHHHQLGFSTRKPSVRDLFA